MIQNELMNGALNDLILNKIIKNKEDIIIKNKNYVLQITSPENQINNIYNNISNIIISDETKNKLKNCYEIKEDEQLIILKVDYFMDDLLIPIIEYEIYTINDNLTEKLDINICNDLKIDILYTANINIDEEFKYNPYDKYYNDICYEITLYDKKKEYNDNKMALCEKDCKYNGYILDIKKVKCTCNIKIEMPLLSDIVINKEKLIYNFKNIKNYLL